MSPFRRKPYSGRSIELWSGGWMDLADPGKADFTREDVIIGLSHVCRFAGQCRRFYSVAEHSVLVANLLAARGYNELAVYGLLHDAAEAFIGDMTGPMKYQMRTCDEREYDRIGAHLDVAVMVKFDLPDLTPLKAAEVKRCDDWAFVLESRSLLNSNGAGYEIPKDILELGGMPRKIPWYAGLQPLDARDLMRQKWDDLFGAMDAPREV